MTVVRTARTRPLMKQYIVSTPGTMGGRPRIAGQRIRVQDIANWHERGGMSPDEIAREFDLTLAEVHAALAYYFEHRVAIQRDIERDNRFAEEMKRRTPSLVQEKLRRVRG